MWLCVMGPHARVASMIPDGGSKPVTAPDPSG